MDKKLTLHQALFNQSPSYFQLQLEQLQLTLGDHSGVQGLYMKDLTPIKFDTQSISREKNSTILAYRHDQWSMEDRFTPKTGTLFEIQRKWTNLSENAQEVVLCFDLLTSYDPSFYFIPCVSYHGNPWGQGHEPKGLTHEGEPWIFAGTRVSLPAATFSENKDYAVGLFSSLEPNRTPSSCSLVEKSNGMIHRLLWPEREEPRCYNGRDKYGNKITPTLTIKPGETFEATCYLYVNKVTKPNYGWTKAYDDAWSLVPTEIDMTLSPADAWDLAIDYAQLLVDFETDDQALFDIGYAYDKKKGWHLYGDNKYEVGWCGQHASMATALIQDGLKRHNQKSFNLGLKVLDTWSRLMESENGLYQVSYRKSLDERHATADTCNLSWGAWFMMEAYELLKDTDAPRPHFLELALKTCDFFIDNYDEQDLFGKLWNIETGQCVDHGGSIGVFVLIPLLKAYKITNDARYLAMTKKAFDAYVKRDLDKMQCTAGALDTCCVDKETCWPFLKVALDLYEITKEGHYLETAKFAGYYILSWMMHYETLQGDDNDFKKYGYQTFGGTSVSAQHHHLDPWGGLIAPDWARLGKLTGDMKWLQRARATWQNALCCISDGQNEVNKTLRPRGSQNEAYFHCNWAFEGFNEGTARLNNWLVAWPNAFRLITLLKEDSWEDFK